MKYKNRTEFILKSIANNPNQKTIIDIGFIGEYNEPFVHNAILKNFPDDDVVGIDINEKIDDYCNQKHRKYFKQSIFDIDQNETFKEQFDVAVLCEVFEHLPHPFLALHKIYACLKPGGVMLITYPNPLKLSTFGHYLLQTDLTDKPFLKRYLGADDHKIFPMPVSMVAYLNFLGFTIREVSFLKGILCNLPILNKFSDYIGICAEKN